MAFGIMAIAQLINAGLSAILSVKLYLTYRERKNILTILLTGFFVFLVSMALLYFFIELFELHTVQLLYWNGTTLITTILIYMLAYLLTISLYILEVKILYLIPFTVSFELMILGILIQEEIFLIVRMITLIIYTIPTLCLFLYLAIKNKDGKSLGFVIFLGIMLITGPITRYLGDNTGFLYLSAWIILFIGNFGIFDKIFQRKKEEKTWIEENIR
ncbi:MAG: hypothetical protein EAX96_15130 [Candidatus Lokiarchaeota archaeon]|nr:hypothetical protein [Candidatus Lokiarchaeota archaeon]